MRRLSDLSSMIGWCLSHGKNLISLHDGIDLASPTGQAMAELLARVGEIEAAGNSCRAASLWGYAKTQHHWLVGKPPYGYRIDEGGRLVVDAQQCRVLRWCRGAAQRGVSARRMTLVLTRAGVPTGGGGQWTTTTLLRRLRNPALMGVRVEEMKEGGVRRSAIVLGRDGNPIRVAEPVLTESEWRSLQAALDARAKSQPTRREGGATRFLGVLVCADCGTNMTVHRTKVKDRAYTYLRCRSCPSGGLGAPDPQAVYALLLDEVTRALGSEPVRAREYRRDPAGAVTARGRWTLVRHGECFGERWARSGHETLAADLRRAGVTCQVHRRKVPRVRAPEIRLELAVPPDARERLIIKADAFARQ